jgi:hypothetical protein
MEHKFDVLVIGKYHLDDLVHGQYKVNKDKYFYAF